jgi:small conductance mechanosensitive channel
VPEAVINVLLTNVYRIVLIVIAGIMAVGQLGINITAALTGLGVAGIALGFAAQESLGNMIAGFIILFDKPFIVGNWIEADDQYGKVVEITLRTTRIRKRDNTYVVIPNAEIINDTIINHSKSGPVRIEVPVSIAYKESVESAREVLLSQISSIDGVLENPAPDVVVDELADSGVNLKVRVWTDDPRDDESVRFQVVEMCKRVLDAAGIEIPFPHLQLFVEDVRKSAVDALSNMSKNKK